MTKYKSYYECIFVSREVVSFRVEIYDSDTGVIIAKANDMINRRTKKGNISWIVKDGTLNLNYIEEIHEYCLKRMNDIGI